MFEICDRAIELQRAIDAVAHPSAGGIDVFIGVVRDFNEGRPITRLEYEAYPTMAVREMKRIAEEIAASVPGVRLAALHRVGSLGVGDTAIVCAASAPHRDEAFRACRLLIDEIKARVPVWKREWGAEGPYWINWQDARCDVHGHVHSDGQGHTHDHEPVEARVREPGTR